VKIDPSHIRSLLYVSFHMYFHMSACVNGQTHMKPDLQQLDSFILMGSASIH